MKVIVNHEEHEVPLGRLSYHDVVRLAYPGKPVIEGLSITYRRDDSPAEGMILQGETVPVREGMVFKVASTGNA